MLDLFLPAATSNSEIQFEIDPPGDADVRRTYDVEYHKAVQTA